MNIHRRTVIKIGVGLGASLLLDPSMIFAQSQPLLTKKIPSSGEAITCAVPGMARPEYVVDNLGAARGRLPDAAMRRKMEQFIDTA